MPTLTIDAKQAKKLFPIADEEFKSKLVETFGEKFFVPKTYDRIKTFEDACVASNEDPNAEKFTTGSDDEIAYKKIKVIAKALNENWVPDYSNSNQRKWYPWFQWDSSKSGFRFNGSFYDLTNAFAGTGSRLCLASEELADYIGTQFIKEYNQLLN